MKAKKHILYCCLLLVLNGFSQENQSPYRVWRLTAFSGEARLRGTYRESEANVNNFYNKQQDSYLSGMLQLRTQSFFVHPNFMLVNLSGTYNPESRRDNYIGVPNYSENNNREGIEASAIFFKKKKINLMTNAIINDGIQNIENITKVKTKSQQYGATLSYSNKILPFTVGYIQQKSEQKTIGIDRKFNLNQQIYQASATKSFTERDHHTLAYVNTASSSLQSDPSFISPLHTIDNTDLLELNDDASFDLEKKYTFTSSITNSDERGSNRYKRFYANENLTLKLPKDITFVNTYNLGLTQQESNKVNYQGFRSAVRHQLFESLNSQLIYEHNQTTQTFYKEQRNKFGVDLRYAKKIPTGKLTVLYSYYREYQKVKTPPTLLRVFHEECILSGNQVLLKNENVNIQSVVVKDASGIIIYQLNLDYVLIDQNPYVEIVRVPGGNIALGASVYIDYTAMQAGLYKYTMNNHSFAIDVSLFKNRLDIYYRLYSQDYNNQSKTENLVLNYFTRQVMGARIDLYYLRAGAEYEYCKSSIIPYQGMKYFINLQEMYKNIFLTLNGNMQDFQMANENAKRLDLDVSCKVGYAIFKNVKIDLDYMYRSMTGRGINLNLQTSKLEITATLHKLYLSLGGEVYWNKNLSSTTNYKGTYIQLTRNF